MTWACAAKGSASRRILIRKFIFIPFSYIEVKKKSALLTRSRAGRALLGTRAKNLLLVSIDTLRADHLGCYGYAGAQTPRLDALARSGLRFARANPVMPLTLPAQGKGEVILLLPALSAPAARIEVRVVVPGGRTWLLDDPSRAGSRLNRSSVVDSASGCSSLRTAKSTSRSNSSTVYSTLRDSRVIGNSRRAT